MPNLLAFFMLAIWPLVGVVLFYRFSTASAVIWTLLGGYLLLPPPPAVFDFPLMPPLSKQTIPSLTAFALALTMARPKLQLWPENRAARVLLVVFVLCPLPTFATNTEPVLFSVGGLPGMRPAEGLALMVQQFMLAMPMLLGRAVLAELDGRRLLLTAFAVGGLVYSLPMLVEVRLSPQINIWVYGYFQHYFEQMIRMGGFRPIVFLYHGLWAAFFAMMAMIAAFALYRDRMDGGGRAWLLAGGYLGLVLVLCKSMAALLYGVVLIPLVVLLPSGWQVRLAVVIALAAASYPVLKQADLVPADEAIALAARVDQDRANSLKFRIDNEDLLFERAQLKPIFGWGSWGRNHLHDDVTGEITTVTDGRWIITIGVFGWVGFLAEFGLLVLPVLALGREVARAGAQVPRLVGPLALFHAVNIFDLIPNATLTPMTWLVAGALLGCAEGMRARYRKPVREVMETVL